MENRELSDAVCVVLSEGLVALIWLLWTPCIFKIIQNSFEALHPLFVDKNTDNIIFKMH